MLCRQHVTEVSRTGLPALLWCVQAEARAPRHVRVAVRQRVSSNEVRRRSRLLLEAEVKIIGVKSIGGFYASCSKKAYHDDVPLVLRVNSINDVIVRLRIDWKKNIRGHCLPPCLPFFTKSVVAVEVFEVSDGLGHTTSGPSAVSAALA